MQDNINPIKRVEASGLIMASTIIGVPAPAMVKDAHQQRIADPALSDNDNNNAAEEAVVAN